MLCPFDGDCGKLDPCQHFAQFAGALSLALRF